MLRVLDLFSGIGGFSLGLERTGGFRTVLFVECDAFCRRVLRRHWPEVPIHDDIRTFTPGADLGTIDVVCGGFPCQPWSLAGPRRGAADDRDLWSQMHRIVEALQPRWVVAENVLGLIAAPMGLDRVLADLDRLGYTAGAFCLPAAAVDRPHWRRRVWIVAHAHRVRRDDGPTDRHAPAQSGAEGRVTSAGTERRIWELTGDGAPGWTGCLDGRQRRIPEPGVRLMADGVPDDLARTRLRALGNAVVPAVVTAIGEAILEAESLRCEPT